MSTLSALNSLLSGAANSSSPSIDISNLLAASDGLSTPGIDVNAAVAAAIYADRAPERVWQTDQATLSSQTTALTTIQAATNAVATDLQSLNSVTGPLSARTVTSSNAGELTATAASGTVAANHTVVVNSLATTASWYSGLVSSSSASLPTSSVTITVGLGSPETIATGSGNPGDNLNDLASAINKDNLGVTATVVTDSTGSRLAISANTSGAPGNFSVTSGSGLNFTQSSTGVNASLTVDGVPISSATNTVTGAINGVTLTLLSASPGTPVSLSVSSATNQVSGAINQFVSDYNTLMGLLNTQFAVSSTTNADGSTTNAQGVLASDPTVVGLQSALEQALDYTYTPATGTTTVSSLSDLGITMNSDGTLSVNSATLGNALTTNPSDVQAFIEGTSLNGFANSMNTALNTYTDSANGAFTVDLNSLSTQNNDLTSQINDYENNYIANQQTVLTAEFSKAEIALQQLPQQMQQINAELGNNNNGSNNG
jgi:flagellar hook-associated protein 2